MATYIDSDDLGVRLEKFDVGHCVVLGSILLGVTFCQNLFSLSSFLLILCFFCNLSSFSLFFCESFNVIGTVLFYILCGM